MKKGHLFILLSLVILTLSACQAPVVPMIAPETPEVIAPAEVAPAPVTPSTPQNTIKTKAETEGFMAGYKAIDMKLISMEGEPFILSENQGKVIVLNFWASWCPPCQEEIPYFNQAYDVIKDTDAMIIGINLIDSDKLEDVKEMITSYNIKYPIYLDTDSVVSSAYRVRNIPTTVIVKPNGVIHDVYMGALSKDQLLKMIDEAKK